MPVFYLMGAAAAGWLAGMLARRDQALGMRHQTPFDRSPFEFSKGRQREPVVLRAPAQPREFRSMAWREGRIASAWQPFDW